MGQLADWQPGVVRKHAGSTIPKRPDYSKPYRPRFLGPKIVLEMCPGCQMGIRRTPMADCKRCGGRGYIRLGVGNRTAPGAGKGAKPGTSGTGADAFERAARTAMFGSLYGMSDKSLYDILMQGQRDAADANGFITDLDGTRRDFNIPGGGRKGSGFRSNAKQREAMADQNPYVAYDRPVRTAFFTDPKISEKIAKDLGESIARALGKVKFDKL